MDGRPGIVHGVVGLAAAGRELYALRDDGSVFILFKRGAVLPDGHVVQFPYWAAVPAVPGTVAAIEQEG